VDVAYWALDLKAPRTISATGRRLSPENATETPESLQAVLEFPEVHMEFRLHPKTPPPYQHMGSIGCVFQGTEATLVTNYQKHEIYVKGKKVEDFPRPGRNIPDSPGHVREFLNAIKTRDLQTTCNIAYGHQLSKAGLLANIAFLTGSSVSWDDSSETAIDNPEAERMLARPYRSPWTLT
jgi:hypothetical protein